jgi:hypothetical protein
VNIYEQSTMYPCKLLIIIICHSSLAILQLPYPKQIFELPNHPSNWMCTVHVTVATFANYTTLDITERFLASNREKIIPTVGTMLNRSIGIAPVISFHEPCTISVLIDATIQGLSYVFKGLRLHSYFIGNEYVYRGWRHSIIILIYFSCYYEYHPKNLHLPHRLFYHSLDCGPQNMFPNQVFVSDPLYELWNINDPTHNIHDRELPLALKQSISTPNYAWNRHGPNLKLEKCLASRWDTLSQMLYCDVDRVTMKHYQLLMNFTTVAYTPNVAQDYGRLFLNAKYKAAKSILFHAIDSVSERILYCDRNSDSPRLRPISLAYPFSFATWVTLLLILVFCAIASSFCILDMRSVAKDWKNIILVKTIFNNLLELIMCLVEKDVGKTNCTKAFIGLLVICLGNNYKNYLTIELVFPRAGDAIHNLTELLDLNFMVIGKVTVEDIGQDKSAWLKNTNYHLEIDEIKREKYVSETERWLKLLHSVENIINVLASGTSKNALIINAQYYVQLYYLSLINDRHFPLSCHFVKRPFAHKFEEFYFLNPKAEEFKWWTARFLNHGLIEFWKRLESHSLTLDQHKLSLESLSKRSNSTSPEAVDVQNFIGQVHLIVFYIVVAVLTTICFAIFVLECAMQNIKALFLFALKKIKHFSLQLLWTSVRSVFLMSRLIRRPRRNRKPF